MKNHIIEVIENQILELQKTLASGRKVSEVQSKIKNRRKFLSILRNQESASLPNQNKKFMGVAS